MSAPRRKFTGRRGAKSAPKPLKWFCEPCERVRLNPVKGPCNVLSCPECLSKVEPLSDRGKVGGVQSRIEGHQLARHIWICRKCDRWHETKPKLSKGDRLCDSCSEPTLHFDSAGEAIYFQSLKLEVGEGRKRNLRHHPKAPLFAPVMHSDVDRLWFGGPAKIGTYEADAAVEELVDGEWVDVWIDFKPRAAEGIDPISKWKIRHFEAQTGITVRIVTS